MNSKNAWRPGPGVDEGGGKTITCMGPDCTRKFRSTGRNNRLCVECRLMVGRLADASLADSALSWKGARGETS
jgi:phosphoribosyl 1,2-cyclic phosphodiesterase